jgi:putative hydrolase of the HAD superfamily
MKLLIWDFDGTLAFREGLWSSAVAEVARAHIPGCQAVREDFLSHLQSPDVTPGVTNPTSR